MALLDGTILTLADWGKRLDPNGATADIVELLGQTNQILDDMTFMEGNLPTGHRTTVRTGLPAVYWRAVNAGVPSSKSRTTQVDETIGMLESYSQLDVEIAKLNGNVSSTRLSEATAFIEAMSQEMASTLFYGNTSTDPEEFNGLSVRYSSLTTGSGQNVLNGAGTSTGANNRSSIWLICWGANKVHGIFPKGSMAGLEHEDLGIETVQETENQSIDTSGATATVPGEVINRFFRAYRDRWSWKCGLSVRDWRYAARIANIDATNEAVSIVEPMIDSLHLLPNGAVGTSYFYMNRSTFRLLDRERYKTVSGAGLTYMDIDGKIIPSFRGIPIRIVDALTETEAVVS